MKTIIYIRAADAPDQVDCRLLHLQGTVADRGWPVSAVHVDRVIGTKGRNRLPGLSALLNAVERNEVDTVMVWSLHHLGASVDSLIDTLAELNRHDVKLVVHDHAGDGVTVETVETGGLLAAADLLVDARRRYRAEAIRAGQIRAKACGTRFGRPPVPPARIEKVRLALRSGQGVRQAARSSGVSPAKASRIRAEMVGAGLMG
jgi:DNA invertase Pin-like site-specific DNA recombinase